MRTKAIVVLTCDDHKWFSDIALEGMRKFCPGVPVAVVHDKDVSTETKCPDDIRKICRDIPYLKKHIDAPYLLSGIDDILYIDSDCFVLRRPDELLDGPYVYQGKTFYELDDYPWGINVWRELGQGFEIKTPLFCGGLYSAPRTMWIYNRELIYKYLRICMARGHHLSSNKWRGVTVEQNLIAGLWRKTCKHNPLPALEYPHAIPSVPMKIFHAGYYKKVPEFKVFLEDYKKLLNK